jgi:prevent-host-death family protein
MRSQSALKNAQSQGLVAQVRLVTPIRNRLSQFVLVCLNDYHDYHDYDGDLAMTDSWTVAAAKARLSEVIEQAQSSGPQTITRNGRKTVVVVSAEEWERKTKRVGTLAEFFASSPLRDSGLKNKRSKDKLRSPDL